LQERRSEVLLMGAAAALGMHQVTRARGPLVEQFRIARSMAVKGVLARAIADLGTEAGARAVVGLAQDEKQTTLTRAVAYAALGLIADPEPTPSLARVTRHNNWRLASDLLNELYATL
jgi:hypothetical protein